MMAFVRPVKQVTNSKPTAVLPVRVFLTHLEAQASVYLVQVVLAALRLQEPAVNVILVSVSMLLAQLAMLVVT